jgi:hypothetical protein
MKSVKVFLLEIFQEDSNIFPVVVSSFFRCMLASIQDWIEVLWQYTAHVSAPVGRLLGHHTMAVIHVI